MKIFFLSPIGGRTGSEMMLQYAIEAAGNAIQPIVFSRKRGSFFEEKFNNKNYFFPKKKGSFLQNIIEGIYFKITKKTTEQALVEKIHEQEKPALWYLNTITMTDHAATAIRLQVPYIVHVHELWSSIDAEQEASFDTMMCKAQTIICCSKIVEKTILQMGYSQTALVHECVDFKAIVLKKNSVENRANFGFKNTDFVWAMSGTVSMRKGFDLVPEILSKLPKNHHLIWLGGKRDTALLKYVLERISKENLNFHFLGELSNEYYDSLNMADGFCLLSREDPFPLVMLEAAYLEKPIVGFDSGGVKEFVEEEMGFVVDGLSINEMTNKMKMIAAGEISISRAKLKQRAMTFSVENISKIWQKVVLKN